MIFSLYWLIQANPFISLYFGLSLGLGAGMLRALLFAISFSLLFFSLLPKIVKYQSVFRITDFLLVAVVVLFFVKHSLQDSFDLILFFPLAEYTMAFFLFMHLSLRDLTRFLELHLTIILPLISILSFILWLYSIQSALYFGPFRALINGNTINRWPDLFWPLFLPILFQHKKLWPAVLSIPLSFITLYRTIYIANFSSFLLLFKYSHMSIFSPITKALVMLKIKKEVFLIVSIATLILFILFGFTNLYQNSSFLLFNDVFSRFSTLFHSESTNDISLSARVAQPEVVITSIVSNITSPLSLLFGDSRLMSNEFRSYDLAFYPLTSLYSFGLILPVLISRDLYSSLVYCHRTIKSSRLSCSILMLSAGLFICLIFFPYVTQFPLPSLAALIAAYPRIVSKG